MSDTLKSHKYEWHVDGFLPIPENAPYMAALTSLRSVTTERNEARAKVAELERIVGLCHNALGQHECSDDETLPGHIASFVVEHRQRIAELEAQLEAAGDGDTWRAACQRAEAEVERLRKEYICKCGVRVKPHRCSTETEF